MDVSVNELTINGIVYVPKGSSVEATKNTDELEYVIVRTQSAGVFAGRLISRNHDECMLADSRRLWYWSGAASLSELAVRGVRRPRDCKFTVAVSEIQLIGVIEVIPTTDTARLSILEVEEWRA
jgi:hypothetical protein